MTQPFRGRFDARAYARELEASVLPGMLHGRVQEAHPPSLDIQRLQHANQIAAALAATSAEERAEALLEAAKPFAPPPSVTSADQAYQIFMGMIALRAATSEYLERYPEARKRHKQAANWLCENFGEIIWWNCD